MGLLTNGLCDNTLLTNGLSGSIVIISIDTPSTSGSGVISPISPQRYVTAIVISSSKPILIKHTISIRLENISDIINNLDISKSLKTKIQLELDRTKINKNTITTLYAKEINNKTKINTHHMIKKMSNTSKFKFDNMIESLTTIDTDHLYKLNTDGEVLNNSEIKDIIELIDELETCDYCDEVLDDEGECSDCDDE